MKKLVKYTCSIILLTIAVVKLATYDVKHIDMIVLLMLPIFAYALIYQIIE